MRQGKSVSLVKSYCIISISWLISRISHSQLIDANNFDVLAHPFQGQVDSAGVSARFDYLFDHFLPKDPELGLGGFAGIFRFPAGFFQAHFSHRWHNTLISFQSALTGVPDWHRPHFRWRQAGAVKRSNLLIILLTVRACPKGGDAVFPATKQLQFSYKVSIKGSPNHVKEKKLSSTIKAWHQK